VELQLRGVWGRAVLGASPGCLDVPREVVERGLGSLFTDPERPGGWKSSPLRRA